MTALEELRAGHPHDAFAKLLYRQFAIVGMNYRFPPPQGHASWTRDAVMEAAHNYLTDNQNYPRLTELAAKASDDAGLERLLGVVVRNYLRAAGRRTVIGKLVRRLRGLLPDEPEFIIVPESTPGAGNIALKDGPTAPFTGHPSVLRDAARAVADVTVVRWGPNARREGPVADSPSLIALSRGVLRAAQGSLPFRDLADIIALRLGIDPRGVPGALPVEDVDDLTARDEVTGAPAASTPQAAVESLGQSLEIEQVVRAVLAEFGDREKLVIAWLDLPVRGIANATGLAVSTAGAVSQRVRDKLRQRLLDMDEDSAERIAVGVRDAARRDLGLDPR